MKKIYAEMAGTVFQLLVNEGEQIEEGQVTVVLESMKMEIPVESKFAGEIKKIHVSEGDFVNEGDILITIG
jgi:acetyl-CoA carboxylase biotin carboxyl carrier protein